MHDNKSVPLTDSSEKQKLLNRLHKAGIKYTSNFGFNFKKLKAINMQRDPTEKSLVLLGSKFTEAAVLLYPVA